MNDQDLERALRTQRGPRDEGYVPGKLPNNLDETRFHGGRRAPMRAALVASAAVAGVLAVVAVTSILSPRISIDPGGEGSTPPAPSSSAAGEPVACRVEDLSLTAEPWGAAAGSRGTIVAVGIADGGSACLVSTGLYAKITDGTGRDLVGSDLDRMRHPDALVRPGETHTIGIAWSNWCEASPVMPVALFIQFEDMSQWLPVSVPQSGADPVPPCLGENAMSQLSATHLQPAP